jgi:hypothetical protein
VADFNRDGKLDVVVADCSVYTGSSCGLVGVMLGNGDGSLRPVKTYNSGAVGAWSITTADVNGDGNPDLVVGNLCPGADCRANGVVAVLLGNGDGTSKHRQLMIPEGALSMWRFPTSMPMARAIWWY